jgi:hypothetical protein
MNRLSCHNRGGDRQANAALHRVIVVRLRWHATTRGYETRNPVGLSRWLAAYGAAISSETLRKAASAGHAETPARATTQRHVDALTAAWMIEPVPAWAPSTSHLGRLGLAPKHQLADPALAARAVGVGVEALLEGLPTGIPAGREATFLGRLFE